MSVSALLRLDVGGPDDLAPLLGFVSDELAKIGRRTCKHYTAQIREPGLHAGIGEGHVSLSVESLDNLAGRALGRADTKKRTCLIARHEITHSRDFGEGVRAHRHGHREWAQLSGPDELDR